MTSPFETTLLAAIELLRLLPRERDKMEEARALFDTFRSEHPETLTRLVTDCRPGWTKIDYDILIEHPDKGTVALTWLPESGTPWSIDYAEHWAANFLVTITSGDITESVTIQDALVFLRMAAEKQHDMMERIIEQKLIAIAVDANPPPISQEELQEAVDEFRAANGMLTAASTLRRLREWGLSMVQFQGMLKRSVQRRKLRIGISEGKIEAFFDGRRHQFDRLRYLLVATPAAAFAERISYLAKESTLSSAVATLFDAPEMNGTVTESGFRMARDLPDQLADTVPGASVGPFEHQGKWCLGQVFERRPASLDEETREALQQEIFQRWIREKREQASVQWHWL